MGDFRKKISRRLISSKKKSCKEIHAIQWVCMSSAKKILSPEVCKKKFLRKSNHPYPPQKSNGLPLTQTRVMVFLKLTYRAFSYDLTAAILVSQNNKAAAVLCSKPALWD